MGPRASLRKTAAAAPWMAIALGLTPACGRSSLWLYEGTLAQGAEDDASLGAAPGSVDGACNAAVKPYMPVGSPSTACWDCASRGCSAEITACRADCPCSQALGGALACLAVGSGAAGCFQGATALADPAWAELTSCIVSTGGTCGCPGILMVVPGSSGSSGGSQGGRCASPSVATASGQAFWSCAQRVCSSPIAACAADCTCNDAVAQALGCTMAGGSPTSCFVTALTPALSSSNAATSAAVTSLVTCIQTGWTAYCSLPEAGPCIPVTCAALNAVCGYHGDGCGRVLDCGACPQDGSAPG